MSEINLIEQCLQNDRRAQKELVYQYAPALLSVVRRYVHVDHYAEDYLQEGFINIFNNLHQFDPQKASLYTWMRTIMIHTTIKHYKLQKNKLNGSQILNELQAESIIDFDSSNHYLESEYLIQLIQKLGEPYNKIFNLHAIDGFTHEEISQMLNIEVSTSRSYLFRARQQLMKLLTEQNAIAYGK